TGVGDDDDNRVILAAADRQKIAFGCEFGHPRCREVQTPLRPSRMSLASVVPGQKAGVNNRLLLLVVQVDELRLESPTLGAEHGAQSGNAIEFMLIRAVPLRLDCRQMLPADVYEVLGKVASLHTRSLRVDGRARPPEQRWSVEQHALHPELVLPRKDRVQARPHQACYSLDDGDGYGVSELLV